MQKTRTRLTTIQRASKIMGQNYLDIAYVITHFQLSPSLQDLLRSHVPFSEETLHACRETHVLVEVAPLSIMDIQNRVDRKLFYFEKDPWYKNEAFANEKSQVDWALIRKTIIPNSANKTWHEQAAMLSEKEEVPMAHVMVYTVILYYLVTGLRLLPHVYARTSDPAPGGCHIFVGDFNISGLFFNPWLDDTRHGRLGVASARKSN